MAAVAAYFATAAVGAAMGLTAKNKLGRALPMLALLLVRFCVIVARLVLRSGSQTASLHFLCMEVTSACSLLAALHPAGVAFCLPYIRPELHCVCCLHVQCMHLFRQQAQCSKAITESACPVELLSVMCTVKTQLTGLFNCLMSAAGYEMLDMHHYQIDI